MPEDYQTVKEVIDRYHLVCYSKAKQNFIKKVVYYLKRFQDLEPDKAEEMKRHLRKTLTGRLVRSDCAIVLLWLEKNTSFNEEKLDKVKVYLEKKFINKK